MSTLEATLGISGISIVLLFAAMAVIWGMMALLAKIPAKREEKAAAVEEAVETPPVVVLPQEEVKSNKAKAAVVAVAAALALRMTRSRVAPSAGASVSSPWQAAQRASSISRRNQLKSRK